MKKKEQKETKESPEVHSSCRIPNLLHQTTHASRALTHMSVNNGQNHFEVL